MANYAVFISDTRMIGGKKVNLYGQISKAKYILKIKVRHRRHKASHSHTHQSLGTHFIIEAKVWSAIKSYIDNDGFAGMKLSEYLDRLFKDDTIPTYTHTGE
jgi:hypothetical protein